MEYKGEQGIWGYFIVTTWMEVYVNKHGCLEENTNKDKKRGHTDRLQWETEHWVIFASVFFLFFIKTSISSTTLCLLVWSEAWSILGWKLVWDVETEQDVLFISTADSLRQHVCLCYSHEHTLTPPFNSFPLYISVSQPLILSVIFFSIHSFISHIMNRLI